MLLRRLLDNLDEEAAAEMMSEKLSTLAKSGPRWHFRSCRLMPTLPPSQRGRVSGGI